MEQQIEENQFKVDNIQTAKKQTVKLHKAECISLHPIKDVLHGHLSAKMSEHFPENIVCDVASILVNTYSQNQIYNLLQEPHLLHDKVKQYMESEPMELSPSDQGVGNYSINERAIAGLSNCVPHTKPLASEKIAVGEELFDKVAEIESELCAQITGMLLEMDTDTVQGLLEDDSKLESTVVRAKTEYLGTHHPSLLPSKEEMGEEIYETLSTLYPQHASKITGMLLELDVGHLQQLLDNPSELKDKARVAYHMLAE